jgi:hypothetical protein
MSARGLDVVPMLCPDCGSMPEVGHLGDDFVFDRVSVICRSCGAFGRIGRKERDAGPSPDQKDAHVRSYNWRVHRSWTVAT